MAGFLDGLKELLMGKAAGAPLSPSTLSLDDDGLNLSQIAAPAPRQQGLLEKLGRYAISPEGRLALGTTLRAGNGNENAFQDQARIQGNWATQAEQQRKLEQQKASNDAFWEAYVDDPQNPGKKKLDQSLMVEALRKRNFKGNIGEVMEGVKSLRNQGVPMQGARGEVSVYDPETETLKTIKRGGPEHTEFEEGKVYLLPEDEPTPDGAPAAAPAEATPAAEAPAAPAAAPAQIDNSRQAIAGIESRGSGNYSALGPVTKRGDRAYGRYQVMGANIPQWTQQVLGKSMTPQEFLADTKAQDAVFNSKFGEFTQKYGSPEEAASVWFTGQPQSRGANRRDQLGTSGAEYVQKFRENAGAPTQLALNGSDGTDRLAAPTGEATPTAAKVGGLPANLPPAPKGYKWFSPGPKAKEHWTDMKPEEAHAHGWLEGQRNDLTNETRGTGKEASLATKRVPVAIQSGYVANNTALSNIDRAIALVQAHKGAFGGKNYLGDEFMQRHDPGGIDARSAVANIGSMVIHDRSGAAVTVSEFPRLKPFVPQTTDTADKVLKNLYQMKQGYQSNNTEIETMYDPGEGYGPLADKAEKPSGAATDAGGWGIKLKQR